MLKDQALKTATDVGELPLADVRPEREFDSRRRFWS